MKVLLISTYSGTSGANHALCNLAKSLVEDYFFDVLVLTSRYGPLTEMLESMKLPYLTMRYYPWVKESGHDSLLEKVKTTIKRLINRINELKLKQVIKKYNFDVIHINASTNSFGARVAIKKNIRLVWHIREFLEEGLSKEFYDPQLAQRLIKHSDCILSISKVLSDTLYQELQTSNIITVYDGVETSKYIGNPHIILEQNPLVLTIVGRLVPNKGQIDAIKAVQEVLQRGYNCILNIVGEEGDQDYIDYLIDYVFKNGLQNTVRFLGYKKNVSNIWLKTDIALVCSKSEAFGLVTVEAMCAGALVIGTNNSATVELLNNGEFGILYSYGNYSELRDRIIYSINNADESKNIAKKARVYALNNFTLQKHVRNIVTIYQKICSNDNKC